MSPLASTCNTLLFGYGLVHAGNNFVAYNCSLCTYWAVPLTINQSLVSIIISTPTSTTTPLTVWCKPIDQVTQNILYTSLSTGWMVVIMLGTVSSPFVTVGPVPSLVPGWSPNDHQIDWTPSFLHYIAFAKSVSVYVADGLQVAQPTNSIHLSIYRTQQNNGWEMQVGYDCHLFLNMSLPTLIIWI